MLQAYHRQSTIKPFAPILKDRSSKRWDNEISLPTNISLLSISSSSKTSDDDENEINIIQFSQDRDSSTSRESTPSPINESQEHKAKHIELDSYIFNKHLNGISSKISNLIETDIDKSVNKLFDESKSSNRWQNDDYNPRSIRPPPFSQHIKQIKESRTKIKSAQHRSIHIPVRTTKAEQLKLTRQQSASKTKPDIRSYTTISQNRLSFNSPVRYSTMSSMNRRSHLQTNSNNSHRQSDSTRSCKEALDSNAPLHLSALLIKQMRQDIKSNRVPAYSKPLNSALLHEQPYPELTRQYKMQRIHHWLEKVIPTDDIEYNEYASIESTIGTNFCDKLDDESNLLFDEKRLNNIERTSAEIHRVLPLFKTEIHQKMRRHNLLLTRLELDLYVI